MVLKKDMKMISEKQGVGVWLLFDSIYLHKFSGPSLNMYYVLGCWHRLYGAAEYITDVPWFVNHKDLNFFKKAS